MIVVKLGGGLGNQMFQYATARTYQRRNEKLVFDTVLLQEFSLDASKLHLRPMAIDIFKNLKNDSSIINYQEIIYSKKLYNRVIRRLFGEQVTHIQQVGMIPYEHRKATTVHIYISGNFQTESHLLAIRNQLLQEFQFPDLDQSNEEIRQLILGTKDTLSLHVRRGDYMFEVNKSIFASVNLNYYYQAIDVLKQRLNTNKIKTFVFSDDVEWVKQNISLDILDITYVEGNDGKDSWKDMYLMSCCKHHIIANSSFSWWGAWLSTNDGTNIAPKHWYRPNTEPFDIEDIVPKNWLLVDYTIE